MKILMTLILALVAVASLLSTCTPPQTITICKKTIPTGGTGFPISWTQGSSATPVSPWATLNDGQCNSISVGPGQDHFNKFTESVPPGWTLTNISCTYTTSAVKFIGANANPAFQSGDDTVTIDLNEQNVTCTFLNQQLPACCDYTRDLSTGQGGGTTDPLWSVNNGSAFITPPVSAWINLPSAQWIQPVASPTPSSGVSAGTFQYRVRFDVPDCGVGHVELTGTFAADNSATAYLDGNAIPGATCTGPNCFNSPQAPVPLNVPSIPPGAHLLQIDVNNQSSYSGLIVNAQVRRICP